MLFATQTIFLYYSLAKKMNTLLNFEFEGVSCA